MAEKLIPPYTDFQYKDFVYNNCFLQDKRIEECTDNGIIFALAENEIIVDGEVIIDPDYEEKQKQKRREYINSLKISKREMALALKEIGISYAQLKEIIAQNDEAQLEWDLCTELYRSNPLLDIMGQVVDITSEQIDEIFIKYNENHE